MDRASGPASVLLAALTAGVALAAGGQDAVQAIAPDWQHPETLQPLRFVGALASSCFGADYRPELAFDGNRGTKWVAADEASAATPQWLALRLAGPHEVCDLSVRMQAGIEEVRLRLALMALAGCSISFSDEFQYLPPSRLRLMQQVLPPGAPTMRPLDLFERAIPSVWHLHCERPFARWDVVGLFNHEDQPQVRRVDLAALGLQGSEGAAVFEFWEERFLGIRRGRIELELPPNSSRVLFVQAVSRRPQVIGTDMHVLGGYHELVALAWDEAGRTLGGRCRRLPGGSGRVYLYLPPGYTPRFDFPLNAASARLTNIGGGAWMKELEFGDAEVEWSIPFTGPAAPKRPEPGL